MKPLFQRLLKHNQDNDRHYTARLFHEVDTCCIAHQNIIKFVREFKNKQMDEAKNCLLLAAQEGNQNARALIGNGYITGQMGRKDYAATLFWSCQAGDDPSALTNMGKIYLEGLGTEADLIKARQYLEKAMMKDHFKAYRYLGILCQEEGNTEAAWEMFEKAAERSDITAADILGRLYEEKGAYDEAVNCYSIAAKSHSHIAKHAMERLIWIYENIIPNEKLAEELKRK